jgi:hypothetical protein
MKAIVLTYDKYRRLTDHMIHRYRQLWPDNPFTFRIPFQQRSGTDSPGLEYLPSPPAIKATVLTLLQDLDEREWIYWCIDDKYPVHIDVPAMQSMLDWIRNRNDPLVDSILCCRPRKLTKNKRLTGREMQAGNGITLLERRNYKCIWIHQFVRVRVLRHLFESFPDEIPDAKAMDKLKGHVGKPGDHRLYVTERSLSLFGESTTRGVITKNCYRSLKKRGLPLPEWYNGKVASANIHGDMPGRRIRLLRELFPVALSRSS